ncbi:hypothetical protein D8674_032933 [Pyrus ussuriensis x Pyrus communis]|uniref:Uncharacterized protein n=1 Tax=Pyrus ussuriensis x Pyrus communis TaxID=2448454 RepID=A0A5N5HKH4_9ROSA|nr:hypothetical protein D8674_032933 [Pyrus ussuriensis x Pyrus communis]
MQRWQWWKQESAKGVAKHGQGFAQTPETATVNAETATVNAETGKVLCTELVTLNSQELLASATSDVDSRSTNSSRQQYLQLQASTCIQLYECKQKLQSKPSTTY